MEFRKLIKFGKSSYVITIPHDWIKKNKLSKGDVLYFNEVSDGLVLSPELKEVSNEPKIALFNTTGKDVLDIKRDIITAYITGCDIIKVQGKDLDKKIKEVRSILHHLIAFEILEQTNDTIIAKHFLNVNDVSIQDLVRRIDRTLRSVLLDIRNGLNKKGIIRIDMNERNFNVNRMGYLVFRVINYALKDPNVSKSIDIKPTQLMLMWWLSRQLEVISKELSKLTVIFNDEFKAKNRKIIREINQIYNTVEKEYIAAMDSFYKEDFNKARKVRSKKDSIIKQCDDFCEKYNRLSVYRFMESLKYIEISTRNIARIVMDA